MRKVSPQWRHVAFCPRMMFSYPCLLIPGRSGVFAMRSVRLGSVERAGAFPFGRAPFAGKILGSLQAQRAVVTPKTTAPQVEDGPAHSQPTYKPCTRPKGKPFLGNTREALAALVAALLKTAATAGPARPDGRKRSERPQTARNGQTQPQGCRHGPPSRHRRSQSATGAMAGMPWGVVLRRTLLPPLPTVGGAGRRYGGKGGRVSFLGVSFMVFTADGLTVRSQTA